MYMTEIRERVVRSEIEGRRQIGCQSPCELSDSPILLTDRTSYRRLDWKAEESFISRFMMWNKLFINLTFLQFLSQLNYTIEAHRGASFSRELHNIY